MFGVGLLWLLLVVALALWAATRLSKSPNEVRGGAVDRARCGVLFHGSPHQITRLEPRPSPVIDGEKAVFTTNKRWLALVFSTQARNKDLGFGYKDGRPFIDEARPGGLDILRAPGYIHYVPAAGFHDDERLGLKGREFIRKAPVDVAEVEQVPDVLSDLKRFPEIRIRPYREVQEARDTP